MTSSHCNKCGKCCTRFTIDVNNEEELIKAFEKSFGFKLKSYKFKLAIVGECEHLQENGLCSIYKDRSQICKDFECNSKT